MLDIYPSFDAPVVYDGDDRYDSINGWGKVTRDGSDGNDVHFRAETCRLVTPPETPLPNCYLPTLSELPMQETHTLPYTCEQLNVLIDTALSNALSISIKTFDFWKKEAFVQDQTAFRLWKTTNARKIVGEFVTTLRRELSKLKETAVAIEKVRAGHKSILRSNTEKNEGLWGFIDYITYHKHWQTFLTSAQEFSPLTQLSEFATLCKLDNGGVCTWKSSDHAAYAVRRTVTAFSKYLELHPFDTEKHLGDKTLTAGSLIKHGVGSSIPRCPKHHAPLVTIGIDDPAHFWCPTCQNEKSPVMKFQSPCSQLDSKAFTDNRILTRGDPVVLQSTPLSDDDKFASYIDSQLNEASQSQNRLEAILKEARLTNAKASEVSSNLISLAHEANASEGV